MAHEIEARRYTDAVADPTFQALSQLRNIKTIGNHAESFRIVIEINGMLPCLELQTRIIGAFNALEQREFLNVCRLSRKRLTRDVHFSVRLEIKEESPSKSD